MENGSPINLIGMELLPYEQMLGGEDVTVEAVVSLASSSWLDVSD